MNEKKAKQKTEYIFSCKPNGREKGFNESIYYGINKPYANLLDCKKAGIVIKKNKISKSGAWYHINRKEAIKLIMWLTKISK